MGAAESKVVRAKDIKEGDVLPEAWTAAADAQDVDGGGVTVDVVTIGDLSPSTRTFADPEYELTVLRAA